MTSAYLRDICRIGQGRDCCRYIIGDASGQHCAKLAKALAALIDGNVTRGVINAQADNCAGKPLEDVL